MTQALNRSMVKPLRAVDIVAGLPLYGDAGEFLGVSTGPPTRDLVEVCDETGPTPRLREVPWRSTRIGNQLPS